MSDKLQRRATISQQPRRPVTPTCHCTAHASAVIITGQKARPVHRVNEHSHLAPPLPVISSPGHRRYAWADANSDETAAAKNSATATWVVGALSQYWFATQYSVYQFSSHRCLGAGSAPAASRYVMTSGAGAAAAAVSDRSHPIARYRATPSSINSALRDDVHCSTNDV